MAKERVGDNGIIHGQKSPLESDINPAQEMENDEQAPPEWAPHHMH